MITLTEVSELIRRELRGKLAPETVLDASTELEALGLSSLQISEIVFTLEERHAVEFDAARAADATTLGELIELGNATMTMDSAARAAG